ncbi:hypothetical protein ANN_07109 [Periplaneta americana]|uniref:Reverse transcriptase n=1 Tax=Periplaneta americana TaxID=6978 RepID=A0ABQ8TG03_PERAM|nr:hypothetical protein ANN_07109 [Periplaneta americana]
MVYTIRPKRSYSDTRGEGARHVVATMVQFDERKDKQSLFPSVKRRLSRKVPISPEFTAMTTGHGKLRAYLHRFRIIESPICPCGQQEQTANHAIFDCNIVTRQRNDMIRKIQEAGGKWPTTCEALASNYLQIFSTFVRGIDFTIL